MGGGEGLDLVTRAQKGHHSKRDMVANLRVRLLPSDLRAEDKKRPIVALARVAN